MTETLTEIKALYEAAHPALSLRTTLTPPVP